MLSPDNEPEVRVFLAENYQKNQLGVGEVNCRAQVEGGEVDKQACINNPNSEARKGAIEKLFAGIDQLVKNGSISEVAAKEWREKAKNWEQTSLSGTCDEPDYLRTHSLVGTEKNIAEKLMQREGKRCAHQVMINQVLEGQEEEGEETEV